MIFEAYQGGVEVDSFCKGDGSSLAEAWNFHIWKLFERRYKMNLKDRERYRLAKTQGEQLKGYEQNKVLINLQKEVRQQEAWRTIVSILLLAFSVAVILHLIGVF